MKRFIPIALVCALGWLGFISGKNDGCGNTYYNSSKDQKCYHCACYGPGVTTGGCATGSGQCNCKPGHTGRRCKDCEKEWYVDRSRTPCKKCGCDGNGAVNTICNPNGGQCPCEEGFEGRTCTTQVHNIGSLRQKQLAFNNIRCNGTCKATFITLRSPNGVAYMVVSDGPFKPSNGGVGTDGEALCTATAQFGTKTCAFEREPKDVIYLYLVGIFNANPKVVYKIPNAIGFDEVDCETIKCNS